MDELVIQRLRMEPALVEQARHNIARWLLTCSASTRPALIEWQRILSSDHASLLDFLGSDSEKIRELRQSSPFVGRAFVSDEERNKILREFMKRLQLEHVIRAACGLLLERWLRIAKMKRS
jgi:hypothetical protein